MPQHTLNLSPKESFTDGILLIACNYQVYSAETQTSQHQSAKIRCTK